MSPHIPFHRQYTRVRVRVRGCQLGWLGVVAYLSCRTRGEEPSYCCRDIFEGTAEHIFVCFCFSFGVGWCNTWPGRLALVRGLVHVPFTVNQPRQQVQNSGSGSDARRPLLVALSSNSPSAAFFRFFSFFFRFFSLFFFFLSFSSSLFFFLNFPFPSWVYKTHTIQMTSPPPFHRRISQEKI